MDVVGNEGDHSGPIKLVMDVLDHLGDAWVSSQMMIVVGAQVIQSDFLNVGDIKQFIVVKEVAIL